MLRWVVLVCLLSTVAASPVHSETEIEPAAHLPTAELTGLMELDPNERAGLFVPVNITALIANVNNTYQAAVSSVLSKVWGLFPSRSSLPTTRIGGRDPDLVSDPSGDVYAPYHLIAIDPYNQPSRQAVSAGPGSYYYLPVPQFRVPSAIVQVGDALYYPVPNLWETFRK